MDAPQVWKNGTIITLDPRQPRARALAVSGEELLYVGEESEALRVAGAGATVHDLGGGAVIPGFNDNHLHAVFMGEHAITPDLSGMDEEGVVEALLERYPSPGRGQILRGYNWDYPTCPNPHKALLDRYFPHNPVVLSQYSGHGQWLNSLALGMLGIRRGGPDPVSGSVLRDADGEPTGIVRDLGATVFSRRQAKDCYFINSAREARLDYALQTFASLGITSVQDNAWYYPELWSLKGRYAPGDRGRRPSALSARFSLWSRGSLPVQRAIMDLGFLAGAGIPDWIERGPIKYFLDGTFSTRNACLCEPFLDDPSADPCPDPPDAAPILDFLARKRRQGAFHIIGDRGVSLFLDAYEAVLPRRPQLRTLRIRIEHAQLVAPKDFERLARLGVLVAAQPTAMVNPSKDRLLLGSERAERAYPYRSLLDAGVHLSFGSDIPGESECDPLLAIHMTVNRPGPEAITPEEALRCYTEGSAYAQFAEDRKGTLETGKLADFTVLSQDITSIPPETIKDVRVDQTIVGGRSVFQRAPRR